jgi:hypothetical protein
MTAVVHMVSVAKDSEFCQLPSGEFHPITVSLAEEFTEAVCACCGPLERTSAVSHAADHALVTGHTVTERHVRVRMISGLS